MAAQASINSRHVVRWSGPFIGADALSSMCPSIESIHSVVYHRWTMDSLRWKDLQDLVAGDDPQAVAVRLSQEADQRAREAEGLRAFSTAIRAFFPEDVAQEAPTSSGSGQDSNDTGQDVDSGSLPDQQPRGAVIDTIRAIMRAGGTWTPKALLAEMESRNVVPNSKTPIRSVESAVNRLWREQNAIKRVGKAQYVWAEDAPGSPSLETLGDHVDSIGTSITAMNDLPASESGEAKE